MRNSIGLAGLALAAVLAGGPANAQSLGGRYQVIGANLNGAPYRGQAEITVTSPNTCRIAWNTGTVSEGICMRNSNAFSAAYSLQGRVGLVIYEIMNDGSLQGLWTLADQKGVGREVLVPIR